MTLKASWGDGPTKSVIGTAPGVLGIQGPGPVAEGLGREPGGQGVPRRLLWALTPSLPFPHSPF